MAANSMHNFTTLIKRLEAATSRLEDIAISTVVNPERSNIPNSSATSSNNGISAPNHASPAKPSTAAAIPPPVKSAPDPLPDSVEDFDSFIGDTVTKYVKLSEGIGGAIGAQAASVLTGFRGQRSFILTTTKAKKPDMGSDSLMKMLKPLQECITAVNDIRDANRGSPLFNHLSAVSESIGVLAWVTLDSRPHKHVEESAGSAQYWGNRVLKEYKDKEPKHVEWIQAYYRIFKDLEEYVKQTFPQGIPWNSKGLPVEEVLSKATAAPASTAPPTTRSGPPPPPPPPGPPPPPMMDSPSGPTSTSAKGGLGAVFSDLNKGADVTKGLKKVTADQMTHKNPSLRAGSTVPQRSDSQSSMGSGKGGKSPLPGKKPKPESMRTKKPPVKRLDGNKWYIENYENESQPVTIDATISHSILISRCNKTTIIVNGKANAISADNSSRLALVIDSLVSSVDVIKCPNFALQVQGTIPTILMDQVDSAQVYLSKESMRTEVFSSKSSGINLMIIEGDEGDYKEVPLPEQLRTYISPEGKVVSEIVEHAG